MPEMALARQRLVEDYGMSENPDVLFAFAESMYAQYRWEDAFAITSRFVAVPLSPCKLSLPGDPHFQNPGASRLAFYRPPDAHRMHE